MPQDPQPARRGPVWYVWPLVAALPVAGLVVGLVTRRHGGWPLLAAVDVAVLVSIILLWPRLREL